MFMEIKKNRIFQIVDILFYKFKGGKMETLNIKNVLKTLVEKIWKP